MDELEAYINRQTGRMPPLLDMALVHYQLETIHPFADGNGRVGRMLISLMSVHDGLLDMPILYISPAMERHKDEYIDRMYAVSTRGSWSEWINFFLDRVVESCRETIETVDRLIDLQSVYREKASATGRSANLITLVDHLFEVPMISVSDAARKLGVTYHAARKTVEKLVEIGVLREYSGIYPKIFIAYEIYEVSRPKR
jgi:Fic family protein